MPWLETVNHTAMLERPRPLAGSAQPAARLRPIRILFLTSVTEISGAETSLLDILGHLDRSIFYPVVALPNPGPLQTRIEALGIPCRVAPLRSLKAKNPFPYFRTFVRLLRILREEKIDLVHSNMDICNQWVIGPAKLLSIPVICHTRNLLNARSFSRMFLGYADVLIANSRATQKSYSHVPARRQRREVIYNSVDRERLTPSQAQPRQRWGIPEEAQVALQIGRILPSKGQETFLHALFELMPRHPRLYAMIAGDTKIDRSEVFYANLIRQVRERGLEGRILFPGFVAETGDLYAAADVLVMASEWEAFGRVIVEAMLAGRPVIATRTDGPKEIIDDQHTGFLVPIADAQALARTLERVLVDTAGARRVAEQGRQWAEARFMPDESQQVLRALYEETFHGSRS